MPEIAAAAELCHGARPVAAVGGFFQDLHNLSGSPGFLRLFDAGISAVCNLVNLNKLPAEGEFLTTVSFPPYPGAVTQIPVSVIAEVE